MTNIGAKTYRQYCYILDTRLEKNCNWLPHYVRKKSPRDKKDKSGLNPLLTQRGFAEVNNVRKIRNLSPRLERIKKHVTSNLACTIININLASVFFNARRVYIIVTMLGQSLV